MRTLIYVPIIHSVADMGSLGEELKRKSVSEFGENIWNKHTNTVNGYWEAIKSYFENIDLYIKGTKVYQDGMFVDGEIGLKLISDGIKSGSKNSIIVSKLIERGAILVRTEDFQLVKAEYDFLQKIIKSKSNIKKLILLLRYKLSKPGLLRKRDKYIAGRIAETLASGESGILFIGAYHNVKRHLPKDLTLIELKEIAKIRKYQKLMQYPSKAKATQYEELARYLVKR